VIPTRPLIAFFILLLVPVGVQNVFAGPVPSNDVEVFPIAISCTSTGQLCEPPFTANIITESPQLQIQYFIISHCSSVRIHMFLDGNPVHTTGFLGWFGAPPPFDTLPLNSEIIDLGIVTPGMHTIDLQAEGQISGCNEGELVSWEGTLQVVTSEIQVSCGQKTVLIEDNQCVPDLDQVCGAGTFPDFDALMCFGLAMEAVGGELLDIDTLPLLVAAIGTNPVITALVGITVAGVAGQAIWFVHRRKKSKNS